MRETRPTGGDKYSRSRSTRPTLFLSTLPRKEKTLPLLVLAMFYELLGERFMIERLFDVIHLVRILSTNPGDRRRESVLAKRRLSNSPSAHAEEFEIVF